MGVAELRDNEVTFAIAFAFIGLAVITIVDPISDPPPPPAEMSPDASIAPSADASNTTDATRDVPVESSPSDVDTSSRLDGGTFTRDGTSDAASDTRAP